MVHHIMIAMDPTTAPSVVQFTQWCLRNHRTYSVQMGIRMASLPDAKPYLTDFGYFYMNRWRETSFHFDRLGPIGCFLSHREVWKQCLQRKEAVWIFEEGVRTYDTQWFEHLDSVRSDYDLIMGHSVPVLRFFKQQPMGQQRIGTDIEAIDKVYFGTKCYRVTPRFAAQLLVKSSKFDLHVDSFICCVAMYDAGLFKSCRTRKPVVTAYSAGIINHSFDRALVYGSALLLVSVILLLGLLVVVRRRVHSKKNAGGLD